MTISEYVGLASAYDVPFDIWYSTDDLLSTGGSVRGTARAKAGGHMDKDALRHALSLFARLGSTGALAGSAISPEGSRLILTGLQTESDPDLVAFEFQESLVDIRALVPLAHLCLSLQDAVQLKSLELCKPAVRALHKLPSARNGASTYPKSYSHLPFALENEEPEGGAHTFIAELRQPLTEANAAILRSALDTWVQAILAGAYGLSPIPPYECYVEPQEEGVVSFDNTIEWTAFKVRADPACIDGLVNVFAAFHYRCQPIVELRIC